MPPVKYTRTAAKEAHDRFDRHFAKERNKHRDERVAILSWQLRCHTEIKVTASNESNFVGREHAATQLFTYRKQEWSSKPDTHRGFGINGSNRASFHAISVPLAEIVCCSPLGCQ